MEPPSSTSRGRGRHQSRPKVSPMSRKSIDNLHKTAERRTDTTNESTESKPSSYEDRSHIKHLKDHNTVPSDGNRTKYYDSTKRYSTSRERDRHKKHQNVPSYSMEHKPVQNVKGSQSARNSSLSSSSSFSTRFDHQQRDTRSAEIYHPSSDNNPSNNRKITNSTNKLKNIKLPPNIDNWGPRLQKQFLQQHGLDMEVLNKFNSSTNNQNHYRSHNASNERSRRPISDIGFGERVKESTMQQRNSPEYRSTKYWPSNFAQDREIKSHTDRELNYGYKNKDGHDEYGSGSRSLNYPNSKNNFSNTSVPQTKHDDGNNFSSNRSITYDKYSKDHTIRITKKLDWLDDGKADINSERYNGEEYNSNKGSNYTRSDHSDNYHRFDNDSNHYHNSRTFKNRFRNLSRDRSRENDYINSMQNSIEGLTISSSSGTTSSINPNNKKMENNQHQKHTPGLIYLSSLEQGKFTEDSKVKENQHQIVKELRLKGINFDNYYVRPVWYRLDNIKDNHQRQQTLQLVRKLEKIDTEMQNTIVNGYFLEDWDTFISMRQKIQALFKDFLVSEIRLCQTENVEQHFWKILYYNVFELLKTLKADPPFFDESYFNKKALELVENGLIYFERMLQELENTYDFKLTDFIGMNAGASIKGLKMLTLAIVSAQKLCLFMGDLYRYREKFLNTKNFGKAKQWYTKAQQLKPSNGIPYNQLAVLSLYTKRKFDAVYYHTRSLTSSNPIQSAKESLKALFDEIRKKYETSQTKREKRKKEQEQRSGNPLRRETWIHPEGGRRIYRTALLKPMCDTNISSDEDEYTTVDSIELSKIFTTSYLHVHGKLVTKIGMETFMRCANQMLKEFRILLRHSPIVLTTDRLIQLMVLNMFAVEYAHSRDSSSHGKRSEVQDYALALALSMFGIILERFLLILSSSYNEIKQRTGNATELNAKYDENNSNIYLNIDEPKVDKEMNQSYVPKRQSVNDEMANNIDAINVFQLPEDAKIILPAIKVWCDWLSGHLELWQLPPACIDDNMSRNPWNCMSVLGTLIEKTKFDDNLLLDIQGKDCERIRLPEDITLLGFTPLSSFISIKQYYCHQDEDIDLIQNTLRFKILLTFIRKTLCDVKPPILQKILRSNRVMYKYSMPNSLIVKQSDTDLLLESFSDNEDFTDLSPSKSATVKSCTVNDSKVPSDTASGSGTLNDGETAEIRRLQRRKDELERRHKMHEQKNQRLQEILNQRPILLKMEVRPKYIVPDTNCYIDFLEQIKLIGNVYPLYHVVVPLVVVNELEGLSRGSKINQTNVGSNAFEQANQASSSPIASKKMVTSSSEQQHNVMVAAAATRALSFLKSKDPAVKFSTTKGSFLNTSVFTIENDKCDQISNDDKILLTASNLCNTDSDEQKDEIQYIVRDVVLLTTDRNLRVKALSQNVPVRELPDFIKWSGLGPYTE